MKTIGHTDPLPDGTLEAWRVAEGLLLIEVESDWSLQWLQPAARPPGQLAEGWPPIKPWAAAGARQAKEAGDREGLGRGRQAAGGWAVVSLAGRQAGRERGRAQESSGQHRQKIDTLRWQGQSAGCRQAVEAQ